MNNYRWCKELGSELDYGKPVAATDGRMVEILMPVKKAGSYEIIGYDWFNLTDGVWNSTICFKTPEIAVESRQSYEAYEVFNVTIETRRSYND